MKRDRRFEKAYAQSNPGRLRKIWAERATGVNALFHASGYSGG